MRLVLASYHRAITLAAALVCSSLIAAPTSGDKVKRTVPLSAAAWSVDLRQYGWPKIYFPYRRLETFHTTDVFLNNNELIATTLTHWPVEGLQQRNDPNHQYPFTLHAVVLDATSGRALMEFSWGSNYQQIGVVPREDGSFAVFLGDCIDFYNADLTPRGELKLPRVTDLKAFSFEGFISFSNSPSGRTMLVQYDDEHGPSCVLVKDEAVSESQPKCEPPAIVDLGADLAKHVVGSAISDEEMAATRGSDLGAMRVKIQRFQGPWRDLYRGRVGVIQFVRDDTLVVWDWHLFRLISDDGRTMWRQDGAPLGTHQLYVYSYAQEPRLIAFPVLEPQGPSGLLDILVYHTPTDKLEFKVKGSPKDPRNSLKGLSISPDGKLLAVDLSGVLRVYDLPPKAE